MVPLSRLLSRFCVRPFARVFVTFVLILGFASNASADLVGGFTQLRLTLAPSIASQGVTTSPLGTASVSNGPGAVPTFSFPITAETATTLTHTGSGLRFASPGTTWSLTNFLVNLTTATISAVSTFTVSGTTSAAQTLSVFALQATGNQFNVRFTADGFTLFSSLFPGAASVAQERVIGTALVVPPVSVAPVPEPATWALLAAGLVALAGLSLRRLR